jgi:hypothetical protein
MILSGLPRILGKATSDELFPKQRRTKRTTGAVRFREIEPVQRLKKVRGVAFRPQASSRLSVLPVITSGLSEVSNSKLARKANGSATRVL